MNKSEQISLHVCLVLQYYTESLTSAPLGHVVLLHFEIMLISYTYCINVDLKKVNPDLWTHDSILDMLAAFCGKYENAYHLLIYLFFVISPKSEHMRIFSDCSINIYHKGVMSDEIWYIKTRIEPKYHWSPSCAVKSTHIQSFPNVGKKKKQQNLPKMLF